MNIGVIMGGISSEREISLKTGKEIAMNLNSKKYKVSEIIINNTEELIEKVKNIDFAFIALHGKFGEDGTIQSVLKTLNIPYTGCDSLSSAICMDKDMTKKILKYADIRTGKWISLNSLDELNYDEINKLAYPVVIKPNSGGSSVATNLISKEKDIKAAVEEAFKYDTEVMIEEYIKGDEITCCILKGKMLPVLAIKPKSNFFDYTSKYEDGGAEEIIVNLTEKLHKEVEEMAIACWKELKCSVYARVDMIVKEGIPYILEINTLPGMTKNSLFPKSASGVNMDFKMLLENIIQYSIEERRNKI
ncbi:D-alanine--D-alanine ligase [Clostridium putrefaciens]|uniref:D-alanine--D-alanine ligase n=1 Tax=Clostridium putrefaciens TaxID=99675 RepID=A0A381J5D8_9CLOT|nr:D-alanine--D-alanine ligase [Clostridium putrefaciens]SUY46387.1 D-alanine--D-alanine ligase [Clostridium putrefaciens]